MDKEQSAVRELINSDADIILIFKFCEYKEEGWRKAEYFQGRTFLF